MENIFKSIPTRITQLLNGRKPHTWAMSIGLSRGSMESVMKLGGMLGSEALSAIRRCENVRIDWLLDGRGQPYSTSCVTNDEAAVELLQELMTEQNWNINIVTDGRRIALVLEQPGNLDVKDGKAEDGSQRFRAIEYSIIEVIVGHVGQQAMDLVRSHPQVSLACVGSDEMTEIEQGRIGTWRLLQAPNAILLGRQRIDATNRIYTQFGQKLLHPLTKDETVFLEHYRAMTPKLRNAISQIATAMASGKTSSSSS